MEQKDLTFIKSIGKTEEAVNQELANLKGGFPYMEIIAAATPEKGIKVLTDSEIEDDIAYLDKTHDISFSKFVPASGAASRMFKDIFRGLEQVESGEDVEKDSALYKLSADINKFAFYTETLFGNKEDNLNYRKKVASNLLTDSGLGYGYKPKGVILFHKYSDNDIRTAFAEHLVEAATYMRNPDGTANLTVTISPEHKPLFENELARIKEDYEKKYNIKYNIVFSYQDKSTDTIAVTPDNEPFRKEDGNLLFRPAGHGALIYNLNKVESDLVSIKNIDNVAYESLLGITAKYKQALMGECLLLRDKIFAFLRRLDESCSNEILDEIQDFLEKELCVQLPDNLDVTQRASILRAKLDRPIRVCGMVKNEGEPGGGPYIIKGNDGTTNLQILESVQIDKNNPKALNIMANATHFNPVDLVCYISDYQGNKFNLPDFVDSNAGFISNKTYQGRELKALELPGLWNGAMSDWNTLFVEVPIETFNPVKVVLDLLRKEHLS